MIAKNVDFTAVTGDSQEAAYVLVDHCAAWQPGQIVVEFGSSPC